MARVQKIDRSVGHRLDEIERRMFLLKIAYEKFFRGVEAVEPLKDREDLRRLFRQLDRESITNTRQRYRLRQLKARFATLELYITRNLVLLERGRHPYQKFRDRMRRRAQEERPGDAAPASPRAEARRSDVQEEQERVFRAIYERYIEARRACGESTDLDYESVRDTLKKQVRTIRSRYRCRSVRFRITIEDGKARVKAVPRH